MKTRLLAGVLFALLTANALVAQTEAMPNPLLWLGIQGSIPTAPGEVAIVSGNVITLEACFLPYGGFQDFVLLATVCPPAGPMWWEILAMGAVPPNQYFGWGGTVPPVSVACSFMLVLAGHDGSGWWYISRPLVVHVLP